MIALFGTLLSWSLGLCLLVALAAAIDRPRFDVGARRLLWRTVLLAALLFPVASTFGTYLPATLGPHTPALERLWTAGLAPAQPAADLPPVESVERPAPPAGTSGSLRSRGIAVLLALWAGGALLGLARSTRAFAELHRWSRRAERWHEAPKLQQTSGASALPVFLSDDLRVPQSWSWPRPCVALPCSFRERPAIEVRAAIAHETAHHLGHDVPVALAFRALRILLWFHPVVSWLGRRLHAVHERSADRAALREGIAPAHYGRLLLSCVATRVSLSPSMAASSHELESRIRALFLPEISPMRSTRRWLRVLSALGLLTSSWLASCAGGRPLDDSPGDLRVLYVDRTPDWSYRYLANELLSEYRAQTFLCNGEGPPVANASAGLEVLTELPAVASWADEYDVVLLGATGWDELAAQLGCDRASLEAGVERFVANGGAVGLRVAGAGAPWNAAAWLSFDPAETAPVEIVAHGRGRVLLQRTAEDWRLRAPDPERYSLWWRSHLMSVAGR